MIVLSLFDASGNWSSPWADAGFEVVRVDLALGMDVLSIEAAWLRSLGEVYAVLAAPPCTTFTKASAHVWQQHDLTGATDQAVRLVKKTLAIIEYLQPGVWALENPVGRIGKLVPRLGQYPRMWFQPFQYARLADDIQAERYTKRTGLWGKFVRPLPAMLGRDTSLPPIHYRWTEHISGGNRKRAALRSVTPLGFARAFFEVNQPGSVQAAPVKQLRLFG